LNIYIYRHNITQKQQPLKVIFPFSEIIGCDLGLAAAKTYYMISYDILF